MVISRLFSQRVRGGALCAALAVAFILTSKTAMAVPSFGIQTSQPCSACHMGSFGPRLTAAGRDFKLYGYASSDNKDHWIPFNANVRSSFTHTDADIPGGASDGFDDNDNFAFDGMTLSYAGKVAANFGAVARLTYNGIKQNWQWGGVDLRYAQDANWFGTDLVFGVTVNNGPTRSDLWESVPNGGAPTAGSGLSRRPKAAPIASSLSGIVAGAGFYTMWDNLIYIELSAYDGLNRDTLNALGVDPLNGRDSFSGFLPYGRVLIQKEFDDGRHFVAFGAYGLHAEVHPRGIETAGTNKFSDFDFDALYQWVADPAVTTSGVFAARAGYLHERAELDASSVLFGTNAVDNLSTWRVDVSYSFDATLTPTVQYFQTTGTTDPVRWSTPGGKIDSSGLIAQIDYVPWGKPDSPVDWLNMRLSLQYIAYEEFNGRSDNASDKNTFLIGLAVAGTTTQ